MPQAFDRQTGAPVDLPPDQVAAGLANGSLALDADAGPVHLRGKSGDVYKFEPGQVANALATGAYSMLSPKEELEHQVAQEEAAKGVTGSLVEAGKSGLNQLLLGVPEAIADESDTPEERAHREAVEEYHKTARILGGAAGVGASLLVGGELFKGAELAGQAVEHGILPAEQAAHAALGTKLAATAASYATQGALLASPQAIVQAAWGDPNKAAETLLWGVGAGAALGGVGELLQSGASAALEKTSGLLSKDSVREALNKFANERTAKAFGAERSQLNKLSEERINQVADFAHDEGLIRAGMTKEDLAAAVEGAHKKFGGQIGDTIDSLDGVLSKGKSADAAKVALKPGELGDAIRTALDGPEMRMPMNADQKKALDLVVDSAHSLPTVEINGERVVPFKDAQKFVSDLRKKWVSPISKAQNEGGVKGLETVTALDQMKAAAYQVARDAVHTAADKVAVAAGQPELVGQLAKAKLAYSNVAELEKWTATHARQEAGNRLVSLTDFLHMEGGPFGAALEAAGGVAGAMFGAPELGAKIARVPGMALNFIAKKWMEDRGLVALSAVAKRAAKEGPDVLSAVMASEGAKRLTATMTGVQDTVKQLAMRGIEDTHTRTQAHMSALLGSTQGLTPDQAYTKLGGRLTSLATNPAAMAEATGALSGPFAGAAPQVADAYQQKLAQTIGYLYGALPKAPTPPAPFAPNDWTPSAGEKLAFHDKAEIVSNPMSAMLHVQRGTLSDAHLHALQTIYPVVYDMMKSEVLKFHADHPDVMLPLPERQSIAKFLGTPLGTMDTPEATRALQASYGASPAQGPDQAPRQPKPAFARMKPRDLPTHASGFSATQGPAPQGAT